MISNSLAQRRSGHAEAVRISAGAQRGFTLIEVVVALAIVVVSFMALYGVILQMVNATTLMQEKTIASWIAFDKVTELRLKQDLSADPKNSGVVEMAGVTWLYSIELRPTASEDMRQVIVKVAPEDEAERTLGLVTGVIFSNAPVQQFPGAGPDPGTDSTPPIVSGASPVGGPTR